MPKLSSICFAGKLIHKDCLDAVFNKTKVKTLIVSGPTLTPLPFLEDAEQYANDAGVKTLIGEKLDLQQLVDLASVADVAISLGYGKILRKQEIEAPRLGTFNLHPSALPQYRGRHPDLYALMDGRENIGITLHRMDPGIDTGPIVSQSSEAITPDDTIVTLTDRIYAQGAVLLSELLDDLTADRPVPEHPQPKGVDPLEFRRVINWHDSAWRINDLVRALTYPWPMAKTSLAGESLLVSKARVVDDGTISPGLISAIEEDWIRVGTGGHSIDILELRDQDRNIIEIDRLKTQFRLVPGQTKFEDLAS